MDLRPILGRSGRSRSILEQLARYLHDTGIPLGAGGDGASIHFAGMIGRGIPASDGMT
jgi:hypothetical protein